MSHFTVLVFTKGKKTYEDLLAPYDENIVMDPYVEYTKGSAAAKTREEIRDFFNRCYKKYLANPEEYKKGTTNKLHLNYLENEFEDRLFWTDEQCYELQRGYYDDDMIAPNGDLLSTYNPKSKWDWYMVGGRWSDYFGVKSDAYVWTRAVEWNGGLVPFAFIDTDGEWHERGEMGWWAMVSNEKDAGAWEKEFLQYVNSLDDDTYVTAVDCHI